MESRFFPGGGAFVCRLHVGLLDMELCQGRACRLPAEVIQEGVGLQDLGGRTGHGCGPRVDAREILLLRPGRCGGSADQPGQGPANGPVLRTARRCSAWMGMTGDTPCSVGEVQGGAGHTDILLLNVPKLCCSSSILKWKRGMSLWVVKVL